jgi:uncharacterized protein (TIGR02265 family)
MDERGALLRELYAHCDLEDRLALVPPSARNRGLFFRNIEKVVEAAGMVERYRRMLPARYSTMLWYPAADYLTQLAIGGALICGPARVHEGMSLIGRRNAIAFAESLLGRMMVRLLSRDPKKLLRQGVAGHRQSSTHGDWSLEIAGDRCAIMSMREEYVYIESHYVGAAEGTFEAIGLSVNVEVQLDDRFNGRHVLRW